MEKTAPGALVRGWAGLSDLTRALWGGMVLGAAYVWADAKRSRKNVAIGVFTVLLVVSCVCLLQSAIAKSPIIFIKVAENQVGEFDVLFTPKADVVDRAQITDDSPESSDDDPYSFSSDGDPSNQDFSGSEFYVNQTDIARRLSKSCGERYIKVLTILGSGAPKLHWISATMDHAREGL